ncbi:hypothetical protein KSP35_19580 [Aquihabitans sp. G128]|jgi:hypothetical protein|uniref:hypothetical protein n=1 Tax=Aquihabitans sp. G128 TaxID=2849779 RepID=UPI001C2148EB|nr:hypothetical protein [Aquihabitans sp. G128]QXC60500.1 hypothetical protein KSP35_19580 [Aquihabitans sp. G128]HWJ63704.1 hypothetical protein [Acidimicrobiales bacterium]
MANPDALAAQALSDLHGGRVTRNVIESVGGAATALTRTGRFSTPSNSFDWSPHDVDDLVGDFFAQQGRVETLAQRAGYGPDAVRRFRGATQQALTNLIIDRYRQTPRGVLDRRVERRVKKRDDIVEVTPDHWSFELFQAQPHWGGDDKRLEEAVRRVPIDPPPPWPEDSPREPPATTGASVDAACDAVLATAACPVAQRSVRRIVVERVIQFDGAVVDEGVGQENIAEPDNAPAHSSATGAAEAFWDELTEDDRVLLPDIRTPVRQLAAAGVLGLKKSALASRQAKLERRVTEFALGSRDGATALRCLLEIQQSWSAGRSTGGSP